MRTQVFSDFIGTNLFRKRDVESYFANEGHKHFKNFDSIWRSLRMDVRDGLITELDEGCFIYTPDKKKPVTEQTSVVAAEQAFSKLFKTLLEGYPRL